MEEYRGILEGSGVELVAAAVRERLEPEELMPLVKDVDGVICGDDRFTPAVLKAAPKLKVISKWGTGIDSIDVQAAESLGIQVCNTPGAFTDPVADTVLGYMLTFARQLSWLDRDLRSGRWQKRSGVALKECVLGVVGGWECGESRYPEGYFLRNARAGQR